MLTKEQILKAQDLPFKEVEVPEWGGTVRVRTMTAGERDAFEASIYEQTDSGMKFNRDHFRAKSVARCLVDEKGERLFADKEIVSLSGKSAKALNRLFEVAQELNGLSGAEQERIEKK